MDAVEAVTFAAAAPAAGAGELDRLPTALLLDLAQRFLDDDDMQKLGRTCSVMPSLLRAYRIKQVLPPRAAAVSGRRSLSAQLAAANASLRLLVSLGGASTSAGEERLARLRFGVPSVVAIDSMACGDPRLGEQLQRLPPSVHTVRVKAEVFTPNEFDMYSDSDSEMSTPPPSFEAPFLGAVVQELPPHVRSLIFEPANLRGHDSYNDDDYVSAFYEVLPPLTKWKLPASLTTLHLPKFVFLTDCAGDSDEGDEAGSSEEEKRNRRQCLLAEQVAAIEFPPSLTDLTMRCVCTYSIKQLRLPPALRVLRIGAEWVWPATDWPSLPEGLEKLEMSESSARPLALLQLPDSLRKIHVRPDAPGAPLRRESMLLEGARAGMFPPRLVSLRLPRVLVKGKVASLLPPFDVSLLPPSLRSLHMDHAQPLSCDGSNGLGLAAAAGIDHLRIRNLTIDNVPRASSAVKRAVRSSHVQISRHDGEGEGYTTVRLQYRGKEACHEELLRRIIQTQDAQADQGADDTVSAPGSAAAAAAAAAGVAGSKRRSHPVDADDDDSDESDEEDMGTGESMTKKPRFE